MAGASSFFNSVKKTAVQLRIRHWNMGWNTTRAKCAVHLFSSSDWPGTTLPFFFIIPLPPNMLVKGTSWKLTLHMWFSWRLQTPEHLEGSGTKQKMCLPHEKGPGGHILNNWEPLARVWLCWLLGHCASVLQTAWTSGTFDGIWIVFLGVCFVCFFVFWNRQTQI